MLNLKITTDKTFTLDDIDSCTKIETKPDHIDYSFSDSNDENKKFNYFELLIGNQKKYLSVSGKVEVMRKVDNETLEETFDKIK